MEDFIPTRVSQFKKNAPSNFVSVQYEAPRKKKKVNSESIVTKAPSRIIEEGDKEIDPRRRQELEMKRIRYEVIKFGMSGFQKTQAKKAKIALAISLGAKSSKNKTMNYKKLKELRQRENRRKERLEQVSGVTKSLVKHKPMKKKKKSDGILGVYGKVEEAALGKSRK